MPHEIQKISGVHREIFRLHERGMNKTQIAKHLGLSYPTVLYALNSQLGQEAQKKMAALRNEAVLGLQDKATGAANDAIDILDDIMKSDDASTAQRVQAARGILSVGVPKRFEISETRTATLTVQELDKIKQKARDDGVIPPSNQLPDDSTIDGEYREREDDALGKEYDREDTG